MRIWTPHHIRENYSYQSLNSVNFTTHIDNKIHQATNEQTTSTGVGADSFLREARMYNYSMHSWVVFDTQATCHIQWVH